MSGHIDKLLILMFVTSAINGSASSATHAAAVHRARLHRPRWAQPESKPFLPGPVSLNLRGSIVGWGYPGTRRFFKRGQGPEDSHDRNRSKSENNKKKQNLEFGFEHVGYGAAGLSLASTPSLAQRNPIVISVRQAFAANRLDSRALCSVSRHDPPRTTFKSARSGPFGSR